MAEQAIILIPDISGFTEFTTVTEIDHAAHIITELLELIVASNETDFTLAEIEGDAVLFYRTGEPLKREQLTAQCLRMFSNFHRRGRRPGPGGHHGTFSGWVDGNQRSVLRGLRRVPPGGHARGQVGPGHVYGRFHRGAPLGLEMGSRPRAPGERHLADDPRPGRGDPIAHGARGRSRAAYPLPRFRAWFPIRYGQQQRAVSVYSSRSVRAGSVAAAARPGMTLARVATASAAPQTRARTAGSVADTS